MPTICDRAGPVELILIPPALRAKNRNWVWQLLELTSDLFLFDLSIFNGNSDI
jgi:hypothetical protein